MNVRVIGQGRGVVHATPRPGSGQSSAGRGTEPRAQSRSSAGPSSDAPAAVVFDANGNGVIESWSFAHGGDSFANFTPPPTGSAGTSSAHGGEAHLDAPKLDAAGRPPRGADARAGTPAAISLARRSYQRDGLSHAPTASSAPAKSPGPAPGSHPAGKAN